MITPLSVTLDAETNETKAVTIAKPLLGRPEATDWKELSGRLVRRLRLARGMTQEELGTAIGVRKAFVSGLETGRHFPPPEKLEPLAEALGVDAKDLATTLLYASNPHLAAYVFPRLGPVFKREMDAAAKATRKDRRRAMRMENTAGSSK